MTADATRPTPTRHGTTPPPIAHPAWCCPWAGCDVADETGRGTHRSVATWFSVTAPNDDERGLGMEITAHQDHPGEDCTSGLASVRLSAWAPSCGHRGGERRRMHITSLDARGVRNLIEELRRYEQALTAGGLTTW